MPDGRVNIAFDSTALDDTPTWTRIDNVSSQVASIEIRRGRQTEFDQTETSTATVVINDRAGKFYSENSSSPYFGDLDGKQISLGLWNPVAEEWVQQFRGWIDDYSYDFAPVAPLVRVTIECVGIFDYLAGVEILPDVFGDSMSETGAIVYQEEDFQSRLEHYAADAGLTSSFYTFFTGNVDIQETKLDPGDSILMAMRDVVEAEMPTVSALYEDKLGRAVAHGRFARFDPVAVAATGDWEFTVWNAGDGTAIASSTLTWRRYVVRSHWSRSRRMIRNAAIAYPRFMTEANMGSQVVIDSASITSFGYRSWSAPDLLTLAGTTTGYPGEQETKLFAEYIVGNYSLPRNRPEAITFKSLHPDDPRAEATWALIAGVDISDVINLTHDYPGSAVGMFEDFYVEGMTMSIRPLNPEFDMVELSVNVSPAAYYTEDVFS